jgi:TPR repeat protein
MENPPMTSGIPPGDGRPQPPPRNKPGNPPRLGSLNLEAASARKAACPGGPPRETVERLEARATEGDAAAAWRLGSLLLEAGRAEESESWFRKAADGGCDQAFRKLALLRLAGRGGGSAGEEAAEAFGLMLRAARAYDLEAFCDLGLMYRDGSGTAPDLKLARLWLTRAAEAGITRASLPLSGLLADPPSGQPDVAEALHWLQAAYASDAPGTDPRAAEALAERFGRDPQAGRRWGEDGPRLYLDPSGLSVDFEAPGKQSVLSPGSRGLKWLTLYCEAHPDPAPWTLRELGSALARPPASAGGLACGAGLLARAAEAGDARAMLALSRMLSPGGGLPPKPARAFRLAKKAAEAGLTEAAAHLAGIYQAGTGTPPRPRLAFKWMKAAAEAGDRGAMRELAKMYAKGLGVRPDQAAARMWRARRRSEA